MNHFLVMLRSEAVVSCAFKLQSQVIRYFNGFKRSARYRLNFGGTDGQFGAGKRVQFQLEFVHGDFCVVLIKIPNFSLCYVKLLITN